jgi:hypothetical protein
MCRQFTHRADASGLGTSRQPDKVMSSIIRVRNADILSPPFGMVIGRNRPDPTKKALPVVPDPGRIDDPSPSLPGCRFNVMGLYIGANYISDVGSRVRHTMDAAHLGSELLSTRKSHGRAAKKSRALALGRARRRGSADGCLFSQRSD